MDGWKGRVAGGNGAGPGFSANKWQSQDQKPQAIRAAKATSTRPPWDLLLELTCWSILQLLLGHSPWHRVPLKRARLHRDWAPPNLDPLSHALSDPMQVQEPQLPESKAGQLLAECCLPASNPHNLGEATRAPSAYRRELKPGPPIGHTAHRDDEGSQEGSSPLEFSFANRRPRREPWGLVLWNQSP